MNNLNMVIFEGIRLSQSQLELMYLGLYFQNSYIFFYPLRLQASSLARAYPSKSSPVTCSPRMSECVEIGSTSTKSRTQAESCFVSQLSVLPQQDLPQECDPSIHLISVDKNTCQTKSTSIFVYKLLLAIFKYDKLRSRTR